MFNMIFASNMFNIYNSTIIIRFSWNMLHQGTTLVKDVGRRDLPTTRNAPVRASMDGNFQF